MEGKKCLDDITIYRIENIIRLKEKYKVKHLMKLDANENPSCIKLKRKACKKVFKMLNYYPDDNCMMVRQELENKTGISKERFLFGNGSSEIISLIVKAFIEKEDKIITPFPTFMPYITESKIAQANIEYVNLTNNYKINLDEILSRIDTSVKLIFIINPHNPTGTFIQQQQLETFLEKVPNNILVVLDEAYIEYVEDEEKLDIKELMDQYQNLCIVRTFSKGYGLAGIRLGYLIANETVISIIQKVKMPVNVSSISQIIATEALRNDKYLKRYATKNKKRKEYLYQNLDKLSIQYIKSKTNFVMIDFGEKVTKMKNVFLHNGIIVNGNFYGMESFLRITIGKQKELKKLIQIIKKEEGII